MNVKNVKSVFLILAMVGVLGSLWSLALDRFTDVSQPTMMALFFFLFGVGTASIVQVHLAEKTYIVQLFRLHGWKNNEQAVFLRVYEDRITSHDNRRIIHSAGGNLPVAPRWTPVAGDADAVGVCGQIYSRTNS